MLRRVPVLALLAFLSACSVTIPPRPPRPPQLDPSLAAACRAVWPEEIGRAPSDQELGDCVQVGAGNAHALEAIRSHARHLAIARDFYLAKCRDGLTAKANGGPVGDDAIARCADAVRDADASQLAPEALRLFLEAWHAVAAIEPIHVEDKFFRLPSGEQFRPIFASTLAILPKSPEERAAVLDEVAALGFNGVRIFGGDLDWAGQTPALGLERAGTVIDEASARGLRVMLTAITGSRSGYDVRSHLGQLAGICNARINCILEAANEYYHPTQSDEVNDPDRLFRLARDAIPGGMVWALGAPAFDEPQAENTWTIPSGSYVTVHLDRGRDKWNQVRRVRELFAVLEAARKPVINSEPIGAAENAQPGRRENDPAFFFALGALNRLFEIGGVFHSEDGLNGRPLGPVQRQCAEAFVAGSKIIPSASRLDYKNAGFHDSPVKGFDGGVRAYSFIAGGEGYTIALGFSGEPAIEWQNGWRPGTVLADLPGVRVWQLAR